MKFNDILAMGSRSVRERPLETGLIVLGIALAACVASASLLLLGSQGTETERLLQGPAYREIVVQAETGEGPDAQTALREITQNNNDRINLSQADIDAVLSSVPGVRYSYKASSETIRANGGGGGPGGMFFAAAPAGTSGQSGQGAQNTQATPGTRAESSAQAGGAAAPAGAFPDGPPGRMEIPGAELADDEVLLEPALSEFRAMEVSPDFFPAYGLETGSGSLFTDAEAQKQSAVVVLGRGLALQLFPKENPDALVGRKVRFQNRIYQIGGVLSAAAGQVQSANGTSMDSLAFTPAVDFVIRNGDQVIRINRGNQSLRFAVGDSRELAAASKALSAYFEEAYGVGKIRITVPFEEARLSRDGFDRLLWVIVAFGVGALLMSLINLMNMMLTRALRRQAMMGILGAMGASRGDLLKLQAVEGGLMSLAGSLIGIAGSLPFYGLLHAAGRNLFGIAGGQAPLDPLALFLTAPAIIALGLALSLIPAWQSSGVPITTALRSE